jgi:hypothetical protein
MLAVGDMIEHTADPVLEGGEEGRVVWVCDDGCLVAWEDEDVTWCQYSDLRTVR